MANNGCRHQTLSTSRVATVQRCLDCGSVSVHVGPLSFRLDAATYEGLLETMQEGLVELHRVEAAGCRGFSPTRGQA